MARVRKTSCSYIQLGSKPRPCKTEAMVNSYWALQTTTEDEINISIIIVNKRGSYSSNFIVLL